MAIMEGARESNMWQEGHVFETTEEAEQAELEYYQSLTPQERFEIMARWPAICYPPDRRMERVVQIFHSHEEAEAADKEYYRNLPPDQRWYFHIRYPNG
jgi:hypothetical protein